MIFTISLHKICHSYKFYNFTQLVHLLDVVTSSGPMQVCTDWYDIDFISMASNQIAPLAVQYLFQNSNFSIISRQPHIIDYQLDVSDDDLPLN